MEIVSEVIVVLGGFHLSSVKPPFWIYCRLGELGRERGRVHCFSNRPFPSSLVPLFQSESKCKTFHMKMSSHAVSFSCKSKSFS